MQVVKNEFLLALTKIMFLSSKNTKLWILQALKIMQVLLHKLFAFNYFKYLNKQTKIKYEKHLLLHFFFTLLT